MTETEYRNHPAISRSDLWLFGKSPEKFQYAKTHQTKTSPTLIFGQALHKYVLEQQDFSQEFAVAPSINRRTKTGKEEWDAFCQENKGKTVISAEDFATVQGMSEKIWQLELCQALLSASEVEVPYFWTDRKTGTACKCRVDSIKTISGYGRVIVDLKSTTDASTEGFSRSFFKYGYDFQAAMYSVGVKACEHRKVKFAFIAVEKEPPYSVNVLLPSTAVLERGKKIYRNLLKQYQTAKEENHFAGYTGTDGMTINTIQLPAYLKRKGEEYDDE